MLSWIAEIVKSSAKQVKGGDEQQQQPPEANRSLHAIESRMFKPLETRLGATRKSVRRRYVSIRNEAMHIWTLSVTQEQEQQRTPLVLLHGFAAGVAVWLPNVEALSSSSGREWSRSLYAFDLLGFGRSTRAKFSADPIVALSQFVESVEDWRRAMHLPEMILLAHGFGAYVATAYAIKYPAHAVALILTDPWGFSERSATAPIKSEKNSNSSSSSTTTTTISCVGNADTLPRPLWLNAIAHVYKQTAPLSLLRTVAGLTAPLSSTSVGAHLMRLLRPDYRHKYTVPFTGDKQQQSDLIYDYFWLINSANPTGERAFMSIAEDFGFAKMPMIKRIHEIDANTPVWFIYGSRSWIDPASGFQAIHRRQGAVATTIKLIEGSGHHVNADKPHEFNAYVNYVLELVDEHVEKTKEKEKGEEEKTQKEEREEEQDKLSNVSRPQCHSIADDTSSCLSEAMQDIDNDAVWQ